MKRALAILAAAMMWAALLAPTAALAKQPEDKGQPEKVPICHYDSETETYEILNLGGKALEAHVKHGDDPVKTPYEPVPGMPGFHYDECNGEPQQHIYAVAYTDVDPSDGGYNSDVDVLISMLVEGPNEAHDGLAGAGDLIITNQYPLDPADPSAFGTFSVTEHTVSTVFSFGSFITFVTGDGTNFTWRQAQFGQTEFYSERRGQDTSTFEDNYTTGFNDLALASGSSPSQPDTETDIEVPSLGDDSFLDVEIDLTPTDH